MKLLLSRHDLTVEGQRFYDNGHFAGIGLAQIATRLLASVQTADSVRLLLPDMSSLTIKKESNAYDC